MAFQKHLNKHANNEKLPKVRVNDLNTKFKQKNNYKSWNLLQKRKPIFYTPSKQYKYLTKEESKESKFKPPTDDTEVFSYVHCEAHLEAQFHDKNSLTNHTKKAHEENLTFKCAICDKVLKNKICLRNHLKAHTDERNFQCAFCPYRAKVNTELRRHEYEIHVRTEKFFCDYCGNGYTRKSNLLFHIRLVQLGSIT